MTTRTRNRSGRRAAAALIAAGALVFAVPGTSSAQAQTPADPRQGLAPSTSTASDATLVDGGEASRGVDELGNAPTGTWAPPILPMNGNNINSDLAFFQGDKAVMGNYQGFSIYDVANASAPRLLTTVSCFGSQNDVSVVGDLLFLSVESSNARIDCGQPVAGQAGDQVFRGVRIFDISDLSAPRQLAGVQTCRGSHTHTVVTRPGVTDRLWLYVSGTAGIRPATQLATCSSGSSVTDRNTSNFRIDVIEVPLATPAEAKVVSNPRIFSECGSSACEGQVDGTTKTHPDPRYGQRSVLNWLNTSGVQPTYPADSPRAPGGQSVSQSSACHDITAYPALGLAAGACQGDGLLLDITDPVNPVRIDNVTDFNFAYWHSATFNDAGTKVVFTDEWGGGGAARCTPTYNAGTTANPVVRDTPKNWGANAIFDIVTAADGSRKMEFKSYYKIPNVQSANENCVAHNGSLVPVPGRDVMVQAWYQGGTSVFDFTDSAAPREVGFFDRGPVVVPTTNTNGTPAVALGGFWSTYWNNGKIVGSEIRRGLDVFGLSSNAFTASQLGAAKAVRTETNNVQSQKKIAFPASFTTVRGFYDSAVQLGALTPEEAVEVKKFIDRAEGFAARNKKSASSTLNAKAGELTRPGQQGLANAMRDLAASL